MRCDAILVAVAARTQAKIVVHTNDAQVEFTPDVLTQQEVLAD